MGFKAFGKSLRWVRSQIVPQARLEPATSRSLRKTLQSCTLPTELLRLLALPVIDVLELRFQLLDPFLPSLFSSYIRISLSFHFIW